MVKTLLVVVAAMILTAGTLHAQETKQPGSTAGAADMAASSPQGEIIPEWLYGEVVSVDIAGKSFQVRYLDYNTDIEKQGSVFVDDKTLLEGVKSLQDIKPQDTVSIDYIVDADGKFRAVAVSLETFEEDPESVLEELAGEPEKVGPAAGK